MSKTWAVIGGGNGGHATAGHLSLNGEKVRIYDISENTVDVINNQGGVYVEGVLNGFGKIEFATTNMEKAIENADIIMIVAPSFAHSDIAEKASPYLKSHQKVVLHPATILGSIEFLSILRKTGNYEDITICEIVSLLYAARLTEIGKVNIMGIKDSLPIATIPADRADEMIEILTPVFPQMNHKLTNILEAGLLNLNCVMHPLPTLLCTSLIEQGGDWLYYYDGITNSVGNAAVALDNERVKLAKKLGLEVDSIEKCYYNFYGVTGDNLSEITSKVKAYSEIKGHSSINTRYLHEDIPYAIIPMIGLAKMIGVEVPIMEATVILSQAVLQIDFYEKARTVEKLGINEMNIQELLEYVTLGDQVSLQY